MKKNYKKVCESCEYFIQHYVLFMGEYVPVRCGTCMCNKPQKEKFKDKNGCTFWKAKN